MILLIISWIISVAVVYGTGLSISIYLKNSHLSFYEKFFVGITSISALSGVLSLFAPVNLKSTLIIAILAAVLLLKHRGILDFSAFKKGRKGFLGLFTVLFILLVALNCIKEIEYYDTGLYHHQAIKWIQQYAVVPGLGNLHGRFGFNSHFFITSALFTFPWKDTIVYPLNAVMLIVLVLYLMQKLKQALTQNQRVNQLALYVLIALCIVLFPEWIQTPSPDFSSAILVIFTFFYFIENWNHYTVFKTVFLTLLSTTAITFKLSNVFLIILPLAALANAYGHDKKATLKQVIVFFGGCLLVLLPFAVRNVVLSGYLIYPNLTFDFFNVDWKVPAEFVVAERNYIESWAKVLDKDVAKVLALPFNEWFPIWFQRKSMFMKIVLVSALAVIPGLVITLKNKMYAWTIAFVVIIFTGIIWFAQAPNPRFILGFIITGVALSVGVIFGKFVSRFRQPGFGSLVVSYVGLMIASMFVFKYDFTVLDSRNIWIPKPYPTSQTREIKLDKTFYLVPISDDRCWDADLPCAPEVLPVEMRGSTFQQGFRTITHNSR